MSALYYKTGGEGRFCSFLVAGLLAGFMMLGPRAINYFPRPLAGCLLTHLGAVLLWESVVETWHKVVDVSEYATIWLILLSMTSIGFMEGLGMYVAQKLMWCEPGSIASDSLTPDRPSFTHHARTQRPPRRLRDLRGPMLADQPHRRLLPGGRTEQ